jgi:hypothetical protein
LLLSGAISLHSGAGALIRRTQHSRASYGTRRRARGR